MAQCRRCGFLFASATPFAPGRPPHSSAVEAPAAVRYAQQRRRYAGPLALLVCLGLIVLLLGVGRTVLTNAGMRPPAFPARGLPEGSNLNGAPADAASPPGKLSFFVESNGQEEMPVLTFRNLADGIMTLTLRDRYGHVYRASSRQAELARLQVPAGDYSVSLENSNPLIHPNWGDATFRKFKAYNALFVVGHSDTRIHLGD